MTDGSNEEGGFEEMDITIEYDPAELTESDVVDYFREMVHHVDYCNVRRDNE